MFYIFFYWWLIESHLRGCFCLLSQNYEKVVGTYEQFSHSVNAGWMVGMRYSKVTTVEMQKHCSHTFCLMLSCVLLQKHAHTTNHLVKLSLPNIFHVVLLRHPSSCAGCNGGEFTSLMCTATSHQTIHSFIMLLSSAVYIEYSNRYYAIPSRNRCLSDVHKVVNYKFEFVGRFPSDWTFVFVIALFMT